MNPNLLNAMNADPSSDASPLQMLPMLLLALWLFLQAMNAG